MFLRSPIAQADRNRWLARHPQWHGYWSSDAGDLLIGARSLCAVSAELVGDSHLRSDLAAAAGEIEEHLFDVLSALVVTRRDVEMMFDQLREANPRWPEAIPAESWERLAGSHNLRDISDVILDGGDYWTAIEIAVEDEFAGRQP